MNGALQQVEWESCLVEPFPDPALQSYARRRWGIPNPMITYFASVPWLARAVVDLHLEYGLLMHLDQAQRIWSCWSSARRTHAASATPRSGACSGLRACPGRESSASNRTSRGPTCRRGPGGDRLRPQPVALGPAGARAGPRASARAGLGLDEMQEIAFTVAMTDFNNRAYTIPAIPARPIERMPDRLHVRLLRPLRGLREKTSLARAAHLRDSVPPYPYGRLVEAYAGSPIGAILARTLEEMWASPISRGAASF